MLYPPDGAMGRKPPTKFHTFWKGPFRVVNTVGSKYTVQHLVTGKNQDFHVAQLKLFVYDPARVNPEEIAYRDDQSFTVENVLLHRGDTKKNSTLEFLIKWQGYDDSENTWEPWSKDIRENSKVHEYLILNGLKNVIPREFRENYPDHFDNNRH